MGSTTRIISFFTSLGTTLITSQLPTLCDISMLALYDDVYGSQKGENLYQKKKGESRQREHALPVGVSNQLCIDRSLSHNNQIALELSPLGLLVAKPTHASFKFSLGVLLTNFPHIFHNPVLIGCVHVHYILSFLFCFF